MFGAEQRCSGTDEFLQHNTGGLHSQHFTCIGGECQRTVQGKQQASIRRRCSQNEPSNAKYIWSGHREPAAEQRFSH